MLEVLFKALLNHFAVEKLVLSELVFDPMCEFSLLKQVRSVVIVLSEDVLDKLLTVRIHDQVILDLLNYYYIALGNDHIGLAKIW